MAGGTYQKDSTYEYSGDIGAAIKQMAEAWLVILLAGWPTSGARGWPGGEGEICPGYFW